MITILTITGIVLSIALSAFFSASEMAISSANRLRLENESEKGSGRAKKALHLVKHFDDSISTILIGNNLVNIAASSLASVLVITLTGEDTLTWIATTIITILVIIFGESIPKIAAKKNANRFSLFAAPFIRFLQIILKPVVYVVVKLVHLITSRIKSDEDASDEDEEMMEFESIIDTAEDEGVLDEDQSELLHAVIDFSDISAAEVMTARVDVEAIDIDDSIEEILGQLGSFGHSRIPVYEDSIDNIIGVLHLNHLYKALADYDFAEGVPETFDLRNLLLEPVYVYKTMKLPTVLRSLKKANIHLAIVTDEYAGTLGVVTFEDVVEEIVGEIWDEKDEAFDEVYQTTEDTYIVDGDMPIYDFMELIGIDEDEIDCESDTAGGFVIEMLERFPEATDTFDYEGFRITVTEASERRVEQLRVEKL